jgi:hypothetical protein
MRLFSLRLLSVLLVSLFATTVFAHDITITGTQNFSSLDGSSADHDGVVNGVFTVSDGNLVVNGVVNCNDDTTTSACPMSFAVSGNMTINSGGALYAENRSGSGTGAAITLTVGGNLALNGTAIVSTASKSSSGSTGGAITANVSGSVALASGTTIDSGAANAAGGVITIAAGNVISVDGNVLSGPSRTILSTRLTDVALDGGTGNTVGGAITIGSSTFVEPALTVGANANIISQGSDGGAGPVKLDACGIQIKGLVAALSKKDGASQVSIRSGKDVLVDGRDLGGSGTRMGRVRADASPSGTAVNRGVDIFAGETVDIFGPSGSLYIITSHPSVNDSKSYGGLIRIISLGEGVNASGNVIDSGRTASGDTGGTVQISAKGDVNLNTAVIRTIGDSSTGNPNRGGGSIIVRSYSGNVVWTNGTGDVRPVGSSSGLAPADQGSITLTACGTVNTTGSTFPSNGTPTSPLPDTHTGSCSPAAPSLPSGVPPLVTCNTPPVANDTAATTNEDTAVTITMTGSDADGDSLTFTIVSGPSHGTLGPVVFVNATTSTVNYTPALNYNGTDSFVFRANDGNGGTDDATATITINPVNDPPSFQIGPTVTVLEDSGAQTVSPWVTAISPGPADESAQTVTFTTTNNNNALFSVQPFVASNGTLTFTPAPNAFGSATITVTAKDNGGIANGGNDTSAPQTSTITVTAVNDEPSFVKGADQTVNEDAGPQTVTPWATAISAGPNESGQTLTFVTSNNNNALFSAQPSVSASGTLTYTPAPNANGTAIVTVYLMDNGGTANGGDDTSPSQTFNITVNAVNDAPSFTSGGNVTVDEDSGAYSAAWATSISAGPADESGQTVTFNTSNNNNALFSVQPSISASGVLTFTIAANTSGSATVTVTLSDNGGIANGGSDTSAPQTFTITVNSVNDEPSFTGGGNVTVNEDSGAYSAAWATSISAGPNEGSQTVTFHTSNDNNALFAVQPSISASGVLTFTPASDAFGTATVSVYLTDDGGTANGGDDTSPTQTFTITVNSVNDAPSFTGGGDVTVLEDSGAYSASWATAISAGPANESSQTLTFNIVSNSNPSLFASGPSISASGVLSFTPAPNAFGSATLVINLKDNGGTANGGVDTSSNYTFTINVTAVNDAPSFTPGGDVTVNEDSGLYSATWATAISAGPNESGQTVAFTVTNNNNALFLVQPSISASGVLTFTSAPNAFGSATVTVFLSDNGGTSNGGVDTSASVQFTITVTAVNDGPTAGNDSWETFGNTELRVDLPGGLTPKVSDTTPSGNGVRDNDTDPEGDPTVVTGIVGCSDVTAPFDCTLGDGSVVSMLANGSFSYTPGPGNTTGSFQYTVTDIPAFGSPATSTGTVNITIHEMIWYVNGLAVPGGNGTSISPLDSFSGINGPGGAGDADGPNDYIFVHSSLVNSSIPLELGQKLWGEGYGLSINQNLNGNGSPTVLVPAGVKPIVSFGTDVVTANRTGIDIAGLSLSSSSGNAIDVTTTALGPAAGVTIHDNVITGAGQEGILVNGNTASGTTVSVDNTPITSTGNAFDASGTGLTSVSYTNGTVNSGGSGVRVNGAGGTMTITGLSNVTVDGNTVGTGISVTSATFDAVAGGSFNTVNGGTISVGSVGNPVGAAGISMSGVSGDYAIGTLTVFGGTSGASIGGSGLYTGSTGMRISNTGGSISAPGVALSVTNATIGAANMNFSSINSTGGTNGIVLNNTGSSGGLTVTGTGSADSGGTLLNQTGDSISLNATSNVSLTQMQITNSGDNAVDATNVNGLTLDSVDVTTTANSGIIGNGVTNFKFRNGSTMTGAGNAANEHGIFITDLFGANNEVNGSSVTGSAVINLFVVNNSSTPGTLAISNSTLNATATPFGGDSVSITTNNSANLTVNATGGNNFNNNQGDGIQLASNGSSTLNATLNGATSNYNGNLGSAINVAAANSSLLTTTISGFTGLSTGTTPANGLNVINIQNFNTSTINATVQSNTITGLGNNASGIRVIQENNGVINANINNNAVSGLVGSGILAQARTGTGKLNLTINLNSVNLSSGFPLDAINIESGSSAGGDTNTICLNMFNNTSSATGQQGYRLRQRAGTVFNLQNFAGNGAVAADITTWVNTTKSNVGSTDIVIGTAFSNAPANCATP